MKLKTSALISKIIVIIEAPELMYSINTKTPQTFEIIGKISE